MSLDPLQQKEIMDILILSLEGEAGSEDMLKLKEILDVSSEARDYYLRAIIAAECIRKIDWETQTFAEDAANSESLNSVLWKALAEAEKTAPAVEIAVPQETQDIIQKVQYPKINRKISKGSLITLCTAVAAIVLIFVFARFAPQETGIKVAVLSDCINAKWADMDGAIEKGASVFTSRKSLLLREGIVELLFDNQAKVTIESPAEFEIVTGDQVKLNYGRLYATVPQNAIGFTVQTPSARIIDLGTEFGIDTSTSGDTSLHVIKGKTTLIAGENSDKISMEVSNHTAVRVSGNTRKVSDIPCDEHLFARFINSQTRFVWRGQKTIDLADIVGGGNGQGTGKQSLALTLKDTAIASNMPVNLLTYDKSTTLEIRSNPFIDSLFIPKGKTRLCSKEEIVAEFPATSGLTFGCVTNGGIASGAGEGWEGTLLLGGREYGTPGTGMIHIHSNLGITFDLNQIRQSIPGLKIVGFSSLCGVTETAQQMPGYNSAVHSWVDFRVLVDGVVRFKKEKVSLTSGPVPINIKLEEKDRYLSLAVTDNDGSVLYDWAIFAQPKLEISSE